jgi:hypothetical protein
MKTKIVVFLSCILMLPIGCSDNEDLPQNSDEPLSLMDTKWKLSGIFDVQNNSLRALEPIECYTLSFETDSTGFGHSSTNSIVIHLNEMPPVGIMTEVGELGDGYQFVDALLSVYSYVRENDELKFFYKKDGSLYYLLYRQVESQTDIQGLWKVKSQNILGEWINIILPPEDALYSDISIQIPDTVKGYINGNTFYNYIWTEFEINEKQQISFKNYGGSRIAENDFGRSFEENLLNAVKFNISQNELIFMDSQNEPIIIFIHK